MFVIALPPPSRLALVSDIGSYTNGFVGVRQRTEEPTYCDDDDDDDDDASRV